MASRVTIPTALIVVAVFASYHTEAFIGINWGRQSAQRLLPSQVVDLLLQNGVGNARIFTSQEDILKAFAGSRINLTISISNLKFNADKWFRGKAPFILNANVRTVIVGSGYIFTPNPNITKIDEALSSLRALQHVFEKSGNGYIKANGAHSSSILTGARRPSDCEFIDEIKDKMIEFIDFLRSNNAPFLVDINPILDGERSNLSISFALPSNTAYDIVIQDIDGAVYTNIFEWQYDCFAWALHKLNASNIKIVVSSVGWPTDGYGGANTKNAEGFFSYVLPLVSGNKGTPMRPGAPIDTYVHELTDEPKRVSMNPVDRHWGIYRSNGQPKYKIDLSGKGLDVYPKTMKGIMRMPNRWCVFNGNKKDMEKVIRQTERACTEGDCTTLAPGASCSGLSFDNNVSYAFNVYFHTLFQDEKACDFEGLGFLSEQDPSEGECLFPVEVVKGQQQNYNDPSAAGDSRLHCMENRFVLVLVFVLSILGGRVESSINFGSKNFFQELH